MTTKAKGFPTYSIKGKQVEFKTFRFQVKSVDEDEGTITGYLSTFGNVDLGKDRVVQGAFKKTLDEANQRKQNGRKFLFPMLWMHDPEQPIGGFTEAQEDSQGLLVTAQLDISVNSAGVPNNPIATRIFSGFKAGYVDELSIGYITIQREYDKQGVRNLKEVALVEGSGVVMNFAMNPEAVVPASGVKSMSFLQTKGASGKTSWPLGDREAAWDNGAAHKRIVAHFTDSDDKLDVAGMKSVHFWSPDGDAAQNVSEYKLLFCDVVDGEIKAMPRAIFACAGSHGVDGTTGVSDSDKATIKSKIETYYKKMAKEFDDDSIKVPWDDSGKRGRFRMDRKDFNDRYREECIEDWLYTDFGNLMSALRQSIIDIFLIGDEPQSDIETTILNDGDGGPGFVTALKAFVQKGIDLDVASYLNEILAEYPGCSPDYIMYYMSQRNPELAQKAGRTISADTQSKIEQHQQEMQAMLDDHHKTVADSVKAMQQKVSDLTQLWADEGQGPAYANDTGKSRFALPPARREPPTKALPRPTTSEPNAQVTRQQPLLPTKSSTALNELTLADLESLLGVG